MNLRTLLISGMLTMSLSVAADGWKGRPVDFSHGRIMVSENHRFLQHEDGTPFFYLGDTAWELFHRLSREEADAYLSDRASKGFTVIQAVAIAELDGHTVPNAYGHLPLDDFNPASPAVTDGPDNDYWDHVDYIVRAQTPSACMWECCPRGAATGMRGRECAVIVRCSTSAMPRSTASFSDEDTRTAV